LASLSPPPTGHSQQQLFPAQFSLEPINLPKQHSHTEKLKPKRIRRRTDGSGATSSGKKPNPWGEESYSDLIARALCNTIDGRLKLNEIYQWFSDNIPYFAARSSQEEAQGWKVQNIDFGHKKCFAKYKKIKCIIINL
jgi:hypothetical protein